MSFLILLGIYLLLLSRTLAYVSVVQAVFSRLEEEELVLVGGGVGWSRVRFMRRRFSIRFSSCESAAILRPRESVRAYFARTRL
jgi:hypothetical protein